MSTDVAFVGDVHGNLAALEGLIAAISSIGRPHAVFLGDYINKGEHSSQVMETLIAYSSGGHATLLRGNHETALLEAVDSRDLKAFLRIGGAMTIRSYIGRSARPDVLADFLHSLPEHHVHALRNMTETYERDDVIARHIAPASVSDKFVISAHSPVGLTPRILEGAAQLDTGCGSSAGRLTALLWPSQNYLQVDSNGAVLST